MRASVQPNTLNAADPIGDVDRYDVAGLILRNWWVAVVLWLAITVLLVTSIAGDVGSFHP